VFGIGMANGQASALPQFERSGGDQGMRIFRPKINKNGTTENSAENLQEMSPLH
jgi:hypothetical protein